MHHPTTELSLPSIEKATPKEFIIIKGARANNLKNIDVLIPRNKLIVITGLSGSGKSSLAFDTLFAEGQRMYVESLNSYARQFLGRMDKPDVDYIRGVSPAIAIEQRVNTRNPRSTVGTSTEIYDYLKLLFARIGLTYSPVSGEVVRKDTVDSVMDQLSALEYQGKKVMIMSPVNTSDGKKELQILLQKGYTRVRVGAEQHLIEELMDRAKKINHFDVIIDRLTLKLEDEDTQFRLSDSIQTAFSEGNGNCLIQIEQEEPLQFNDRFERDGIRFEIPSANLFTFNNPYGACRTCEGFGHVLGIDPDLVIPDKSLSVYEGAIAPWRTEKMQEWSQELIKNGIRFDFPIHRPFSDLTKEQVNLLWEGNQYFSGLHDFFKYLESKSHQIQYRVMLSRFRGRTVCPDCRGTRLRKDATYVKVQGYSISDMVLMPVEDLVELFSQLQMSKSELAISERVIQEIKSRLSYLCEVGLGYLTLNRLTATLSGGEFQRIKLSTALGSALVGSMYILDEPSIGLHPRDTQRLVQVLKQLKALGNTVIVVEHEEEVMRAADMIVDIGPEAGVGGGKLVFQGSLDQLKKEGSGYTADYLNGIRSISIPEHRRKWNSSITINGAREHNLKNITVDFPLGVFTVVTGVSGSGKSTLVRNVLYPALQKTLGGYADRTGKYDQITGDYKLVHSVEFIDQSPIGKSSRSNPVTYVKAYDGIRQLFADQPLSKNRLYKPAIFSFNVDGGRCDNCHGDGEIKIEMQFMADIYLQCEVCKGKRFKEDVLEVKYKDKSIDEILALTVDESITFFESESKIREKLLPLQQVGLGYITLGQSSNTLSGGEAQRVKLASFLIQGAVQKDQRHFFIFDEPTTGLHFHDVKKLLQAMQALVNQGHTVLVIEHNMEVIKSADWIIDLGPDSGTRGGELCFSGTPEKFVELSEQNFTASFLRHKLIS
jgi:excinuclease ABC subunit A